MGGAEHWLLDAIASLSPAENRRLNPVILGGQCPAYQNRLPDGLPRYDFALPAVKGSAISKIRALIHLLWTAKKLKSTLKKHQATQVFTNTPRAHLTVLLLKLVWGWPGRWIMMVHDFTTRPTWLVARLGATADIVIANALPTRQWLRQAFNEKDHGKIRLIENGILPAETIKPTQHLETVVNLGRLDPRKGQQYFVEAADLLQERNPDVRFSVVGDSVAPDLPTVAYEQTIKQFAADRKLQNLTFKPGVEAPLATIDQHDALVFTPTEPETFGRVVIEALSRGKLVIAFAQTGPKEILEHYHRWLTKKFPEEAAFTTGENWLLVEPNNAMSLAERLAYFADNPDVTALHTKAAAQFVAENYNLAETKKRWLEVLGL